MFFRLSTPLFASSFCAQTTILFLLDLQNVQDNQVEMDGIPLERQLIKAIKENSLNAIVRCYINGVNPNAVIDETNGDNIMHMAIRSKDLATVRAVLLLFGRLDLLTKANNEKMRPKQLAYSSMVRECVEMFIASHGGGDDDISTAKSHHEPVKKDSRKPICLSMDGGGIRGLVLVRVLMVIERKLGKKFWKMVDWAAGTSTGAILACALARGKSLEECQRLYLELKNRVFTGSRPYNEAIIERVLVSALEQDMMSTISRPKLLITAAKTDVAPPSLVLFRSYALPQGLSRAIRTQMGHYDEHVPDRVPIWKAARYSSAAPTYFPPADDIFADGGVICNNPTMELLTEFINLREHFNMDRPQCVISIGTGMPPTRSLTIYPTLIGRVIKRLSRTTEFMRILAQSLVKQITESNGRPVEHSRAFCKGMDTPFFRFSPALSKDVRLNEVDDGIILEMLWDVENALFSSQEMDELVQFLRHIV